MVVATRWNDNGKKHSKERHAQRFNNHCRQHISGNNAAGGTNCPARRGDDKGAVIIEWVDVAGTRDADAKDFIGNAKGNEKTMVEGRVFGKTLTQGGTHQHVAGIGNKAHKRHLRVGAQCSDDSEGSILTGRGIDKGTQQKALQCVKTNGTGLDAQGKGDGEITEGDGDAVKKPFAEGGEIILI